MSVGTVLERNPANGRFLVALADGQHAVFTLYSSVKLAVGDEISGALHEQGSEWVMVENTRQRFEAFGETGPSSLVEARTALQL